ncbi:hypothetical protein ACNOYE_27075 [Nannocystaceae bacterium ST9]
MTRPAFESVREPLWRALVDAAAISASEPWTGERVEARHAGWTLVLDSYRIPVEKFAHTRMVVALPSAGFRFRLVEPDALSWLGTLFGLLDIEIGDDAFDHKWLIKSNSPPRIRALLADRVLRDQIDALDHCAISLEADLGRLDPERDEAERWDELVLVRAELQTGTAELRAMFELLANTIVRLEALAASSA